MIKIVSGGAFRISIHTDDHDPPHVHVIGSGGQAKVKLSGDGDAPVLMKADGLKTSDVRKALDLVEMHQDMLWAAWKKIHG